MPRLIGMYRDRMFAKTGKDLKYGVGYWNSVARKEIARIAADYHHSVARYVLQCQNRHLVTLGEELSFVDSFVFLHKVRLGDCLSCDIDIADDIPEIVVVLFV